MNSTITKQITRQSSGLVRSLHTTRPSLGFMDWFKMKKDQKEVEKKNEIKPRATTEVIKDAEEDKIEVKKVNKIEFIGLKKDPRDELSLGERLNGFHIKHWLNKEKVSSVEKLDEILKNEYQSLKGGKKVKSLDDINLDDLQFRFNYTLKIQEKTGYIIPDYILTKAYSPNILKNYFIKEVFTGRILKKDPEHLSHTELSYKSDNIYIHTPVSDHKADKKYKKLLKKARKDQLLKSEQLIKEADA
ncbi:54S ribosomal protein L13, mitochondrial [Wickerhamomyces ciferrii]|uniref:Large ribosomal subunit protein mL50 n=1 Tax=Wickerhamomyces ciferrii (strain ATCC 14091 / BCRC 22168 / CBS 111 / JCM 3599 / NBRC 0793 / NRRL Y-1031 F-60-10) TaxID=1206466 RepID=K0KWZ3_WICCF|nr:54S ribosomal protein L13, mitochondrial [Wickerhamomyces ciferrii]CCH46009.1 54S ribosomal protein L13, mitochondrial [Wickerhamomyces ciferrii]